MAADIRRALEGHERGDGPRPLSAAVGKEGASSRRPLLTRRSPSSEQSSSTSSAYASAAAAHHSASLDERTPSRGGALSFASSSLSNASVREREREGEREGVASLGAGGRREPWFLSLRAPAAGRVARVGRVGRTRARTRGGNGRGDEAEVGEERDGGVGGRPLGRRFSLHLLHLRSHPGADTLRPRADTGSSSDSNAGSLTSCSYKERRRLRREEEQRERSEKRRRAYGPCARWFLGGWDRAVKGARRLGDGCLFCLCLPFLCSDQ